MDLVKKSKKLSWLLRHGAAEAGLTMDAAGWVPVQQVLRRLHLTQEQLEFVVAENNKNRLQLEADRVRCSQGHSLDGMPVTQEALEASWEWVTRTAPLVHGTNLSAVEAIAAEGLRPMQRTHVHLADSASSRVGKRANVSVLLLVDPTGLDGLWVSPNGVYLTRFVPLDAIVGVELHGKRATAKADEVRALLATC